MMAGQGAQATNVLEGNTTMSDFDIIIADARVIDGTGAPGAKGDVAIRGDRIAEVAAPGGLADRRAAAKVDGAGLALAPGFIDTHTHDDRMVIDLPSVAPKTSQGVTTVVAGNCGVSLAPFDPGRRAGEAAPPGPMALLGRW